MNSSTHSITYMAKHCLPWKTDAGETLTYKIQSVCYQSCQLPNLVFLCLEFSSSTSCADVLILINVVNSCFPLTLCSRFIFRKGSIPALFAIPGCGMLYHCFLSATHYISFSWHLAMAKSKII